MYLSAMSDSTSWGMSKAEPYAYSGHISFFVTEAAKTYGSRLLCPPDEQQPA